MGETLKHYFPWKTSVTKDHTLSGTTNTNYPDRPVCRDGNRLALANGRGGVWKGEGLLKGVGWWDSIKLAGVMQGSSQTYGLSTFNRQMVQKVSIPQIKLLHLKNNYKRFLLHLKTREDVAQPITRSRFPLNSFPGVNPRQSSASHTSYL